MSLWPFLATFVVLSAVQGLFGHAAAFWFALGGLIVAVIAIWEAGRKKA